RERGTGYPTRIVRVVPDLAPPSGGLVHKGRGHPTGGGREPVRSSYRADVGHQQGSGTAGCRQRRSYEMPAHRGLGSDLDIGNAAAHRAHVQVAVTARLDVIE